MEPSDAAPSVARPSGSAIRNWLLAASVYLLAVLHRSSLAVAGLIAEQRFHISPAQLSIFIFLQLGVYAAMQVPTGVLVDRYGPRKLLVTSSFILGSAQLLFALVPNFYVALLARAVLGCGDALAFVSVLRFASTRFPPNRYPIIVAMTGLVGTVGSLIATLPLAIVLHHAPWSVAFGSAAVLSLVGGVAVWRLLPDSTPAPPAIRGLPGLRGGMLSVRERVSAAWALPGTRLGFWVHFACMSSATAFGLLWGNTYLVQAVGFSAAGSGAVLMAGVLAAAVAGPLVGAVVGWWPIVRVPLAIGVCMSTLAGWLIAVSVFGDVPPRWFAVLLFVVTAVGAPTSMVAFALARDYNHSRALGTASGVVNVGGFVAAVVIALGIGLVLDALGATTPHTLRLAVLVAVVVQAFGTIQMIVWLLRLRASNLDRQEAGETVPVRVVRRRWDLADPQPGTRARA